MRIRFLYHKPAGERGVGKLIVGWTWLLALISLQFKRLKYDYSHEEIWLSYVIEGYSIFAFGFGGVNYWKAEDRTETPIYIGECLSSTTRGGAAGVRFAPAAEVLKHPERWDYIECEVDGERLRVAIDEAQRLVGARYDYWGLFGFLNPFPIQHSRQWYCSELCDWFKVLVRLKSKRHKRISPRRAAELLAKKWGEPVPLIGD